MLCVSFNGEKSAFHEFDADPAELNVCFFNFFF